MRKKVVYYWINRWQKLFPWVPFGPLLILGALTLSYPSLIAVCAWFGILMTYPIFRRALNRTSVEIIGKNTLRLIEGPFWPYHPSVRIEQLSGIVVRGHDEFVPTNINTRSTMLDRPRTKTFCESYSVIGIVGTEERELFYSLKRAAAVRVASEIAEKMGETFTSDSIETVPPKDMPFVTAERAKRQGRVAVIVGALVVLGLLTSAAIQISNS